MSISRPNPSRPNQLSNKRQQAFFVSKPQPLRHLLAGGRNSVTFQMDMHKLNEALGVGRHNFHAERLQHYTAVIYLIR